MTERDGYYTKRPDEDVQSIAAGIMGWKGRVHLHFGKPITDVPEDTSGISNADRSSNHPWSTGL